METREYIEQAMVTSTADWEQIADRLREEKKIQLLHAVMGIGTESGELIDILKKYAFYGKQIDEVNFVEEIGDLFWYIALACNHLGVDFDQCMEKNIRKLRKRYGDKFSEHRALNRDLQTERKELEE